jgi:tetratricopeptide (TPR) repeat protein
MVLGFNELGADSIHRVVEDVLAIDSSNIIAAVMRAQTLTALGRNVDAAGAWSRVVEMRADSLPISLDAVDQLLRLQRPAAALEATRRLVALHPGEARVRRMSFRAYVAMGAWPQAAALGDSLDAEDFDFRDDSTYSIRHIESLRITGDTLGALAKSARSVKRHPGDSLLYVQYAKLISGESGAVLPRGIALFPGTSELHVLAAREALGAGKRRAAIASLGSAVQHDPLLTQGFLQLAELWFEEGQPDSALSAIARAPRGDNPELLRAYAIGRGRQLIRQATDSTPEVWRRGVGLFSLADSLDSQSDSRSLIVASSLQLARSELVMSAGVRSCTEASRASDALTWASSTLDRGLGDTPSQGELHEAYDALRKAVDNAMRVFCASRPDRQHEPLAT